MPGRLRQTLLLGLAAATLAACGGGGGTSERSFAADADAICADAARTQTDLAIEYGQNPSPEDSIAHLDEVRASGESALEQLEQLTPPEGVGSGWEEYLDNRRASNAAVQRRADATEREDADAAATAGNELEELLAKRDAIGEELGLEACARRLPDADSNQVMTTVELASVSADGLRVCSEAVSTAFLEQEFNGNLDRCARAQRRVKRSDSVKFEDVRGVAGVLGSADVTLVGGEFDGAQATLDLVFEDGTYKVLRVSMATDGGAG